MLVLLLVPVLVLPLMLVLQVLLMLVYLLRLDDGSYCRLNCGNLER